ncbi:hypothetical protein CRD59_06630 [Bifidobacterium xylocopae]|uniref:Uncharacterized protein n=2 Tax=Bifidobacterium xylocopae TaxID=2493119 RepID=A0A366KC16_9BIFI|nr:hypothetical protein CRD59_06630 [Bifidobacterium xylocopae]
MRLSDDEKRKLLLRAHEWSSSHSVESTSTAGLLSKYARECLLAPRQADQALTHADIQDFKQQLSRLEIQVAKVGVLMNQVARVANTKGIILHHDFNPLIGSMKSVVADIDDLMREIWERNR